MLQTTRNLSRKTDLVHKDTAIWGPRTAMPATGLGRWRPGGGGVTRKYGAKQLHPRAVYEKPTKGSQNTRQSSGQVCPVRRPRAPALHSPTPAGRSGARMARQSCKESQQEGIPDDVGLVLPMRRRVRGRAGPRPPAGRVPTLLTPLAPTLASALEFSGCLVF